VRLVSRSGARSKCHGQRLKPLVRVWVWVAAWPGVEWLRLALELVVPVLVLVLALARVSVSTLLLVPHLKLSRGARKKLRWSSLLRLLLLLLQSSWR